MKTLRLFILDDHPVVRAGLQGVLATQADFEVVGHASSGREASSAVAALLPDVALVDLRLAEGSGFDVIAGIRAAKLSTRVLVLTTYDDMASITRALEAGAGGYVLKDMPSDQLFAAIRLVAKGERVLSSQVQYRLTEADASNPDALSTRELDVLRWLIHGESNRGIAKRLFISEATVKTHLLHIYGKLGQNHRTAAAIEALRRRLIRLEED
jgi:DNA-binding NarL/FixJ family response regulator